jgi:hypothetical protein
MPNQPHLQLDVLSVWSPRAGMQLAAEHGGVHVRVDLEASRPWRARRSGGRRRQRNVRAPLGRSGRKGCDSALYNVRVAAGAGAEDLARRAHE